MAAEMEVAAVQRFRKKPVVIEAMRYDGENQDDILRWSDGHSDPGSVWVLPDMFVGSVLAIKTLEGEMKALPGDWIIRGVKGEFYPCKSDIFEATYEPAES